MSTAPRTPVHFPRMKVRGRRNRGKSKARLERRTVIPAATLVSRAADGKVTFMAHAENTVPVGVTTHTIVHSEWFDGWGRRVSPPRPQPAPPIARHGSFSMSFSTSSQGGPSADDLWAMLTGKEVRSAPRLPEG